MSQELEWFEIEPIEMKFRDIKVQKISYPLWIGESFTDQIGRLEAELKMSGHLMVPTEIHQLNQNYSF